MDRTKLSDIRAVLLGLEAKGLRAKVVENGTDSIVMSAVELDAVDEAIKLLDPDIHAAAWHLQEELDAHD